jgi:tetratricopeptide (TPR) repeat protein
MTRTGRPVRGIALGLLSAAALLAWVAAACAADEAEALDANRRALIREQMTAPTDAREASAELERAIAALQALGAAPLPRADAQAQTAPSPKPASPAVARAPGAGRAAMTGNDPVAAPLAEDLAALAQAAPAGAVAAADAFYLGGRLDDAHDAYAKVLESDVPAEAKAWALYQLGNCRRNGDPAKAMEHYQRLVSQHAKSAWAAPATVQMKLLQWRQTAKPEALVASPAEPQAAPAADTPAPVAASEPPPSPAAPVAAPANAPNASQARRTQ